MLCLDSAPCDPQDFYRTSPLNIPERQIRVVRIGIPQLVKDRNCTRLNFRRGVLTLFVERRYTDIDVIVSGKVGRLGSRLGLRKKFWREFGEDMVNRIVGDCETTAL
jgi:hypothetical protein